MAQNTSSAVMAQRHDKDDKTDYYPTPLWATRAFCNWLEGNVGCLDKLSCTEPACGEGHMSRALSEYFSSVASSDLVDRGFGQVQDYLIGYEGKSDWVITNPPFAFAKEFILKSFEVASHGVAMLVRTSFLESEDRYLQLFKPFPPSFVAQYVERVPMFKGRIDSSGGTATSYCWVVWLKEDFNGGGHTRLHWIPKSKNKFVRMGDWD
ncbi:SAM-dependent methyltransferase [Maritalea porphyrae]|uniref:SAM-dependent methyltransferase n=1 Tax=Maritalea porphyrae TaxID=880732 RepID=UPI0022B02F73|nr:SAM-dependent methyltransferase [Maritalea porphyrae]MCZ4270756.1 SAM-dependent methyltransferase [Maritalea porphyrae]